MNRRANLRRASAQPAVARNTGSPAIGSVLAEARGNVDSKTIPRPATPAGGSTLLRDRLLSAAQYADAMQQPILEAEEAAARASAAVAEVDRRRAELLSSIAEIAADVGAGIPPRSMSREGIRKLTTVTWAVVMEGAARDMTGSQLVYLAAFEQEFRDKLESELENSIVLSDAVAVGEA